MDKEKGPATAAPSAYPAGDEAALLFVDEAGVTRPATETPSSYAARLFGEEAAGNYGVAGRMMHINRLPVGDLDLFTVGIRITDRPGEKWTRRFNRFKYGEPAAARAATRTFCAAFEDFLPPGTRASSSSPRSLQGRTSCKATRRRRHLRPRLHDPADGSGFRITSPRTGIPGSAASPPRPSGTPPWTGCTWLPPSEASPASLSSSTTSAPGERRSRTSPARSGSPTPDGRSRRPASPRPSAPPTPTGRAGRPTHTSPTCWMPSGVGTRRPRRPSIETQKGLHTWPSAPGPINLGLPHMLVD